MENNNKKLASCTTFRYVEYNHTERSLINIICAARAAITVLLEQEPTAVKAVHNYSGLGIPLVGVYTDVIGRVHNQ